MAPIRVAIVGGGELQRGETRGIERGRARSRGTAAVDALIFRDLRNHSGNTTEGRAGVPGGLHGECTRQSDEDELC